MSKPEEIKLTLNKSVKSNNSNEEKIINKFINESLIGYILVKSF